MRAVLVEPYKAAQIVDVDPSYESITGIIGGYIESAYHWPEHVVLLCNEEGKKLDLPISRILLNEDGGFIDTLSGNLLIVAEKDEDYAGLTEKQAAHFKRVFDLFTISLERS